MQSGHLGQSYPLNVAIIHKLHWISFLHVKLLFVHKQQKKPLLHLKICWFLCRLRCISAHRDHFVGGLSVCLSGSHTFLVVTHSYVSQATHAFLGMLPLYHVNLLSCYTVYHTVSPVCTEHHHTLIHFLCFWQNFHFDYVTIWSDIKNLAHKTKAASLWCNEVMSNASQNILVQQIVDRCIQPCVNKLSFYIVCV